MASPSRLHSSRFWDRIAESYAESPIADEDTYERKLQKIRSALSPDMEIMEFGCGTGSTAISLAPHVKTVLSTDISPKMVEIAWTKAAQAGIGNVEFQVADIEELDMAPGTLDAVIGLNILHLVEDRDRIIAKAHTLLKPGGWFFTSTACLGDWMGAFKYVAPAGRALGVLPLVRVFTRADLEASLTRAGFEITDTWQPDRKKALFIAARKSAQS